MEAKNATFTQARAHGLVSVLKLLGLSLGRKAVVLVDVYGLPGVTAPEVADRLGGKVTALGHHVGGEGSALGLLLVLHTGGGQQAAGACAGATGGRT